MIAGNFTGGNISDNVITDFRGIGIRTFTDSNITIANNSLENGDQAFYFGDAILIGNTIKNVGTASLYTLKCPDGTMSKLM